MLSIYTLAALSTQRWILVTRPAILNVQSWRATLALVGTAWALALAMALPPAMGWAWYVPESSGLR